MSTSSPIPFADALAIVEQVARARCRDVEQASLARSHGRVLAETVVARVPQPPFDNAAMDGFALRFGSSDRPGAPCRFAMLGERFAGTGTSITLQPGSCIRITTGAPLPADTDAVEMKERARIEGASVALDARPPNGQFIRRAGSDAGIGVPLLARGEVLGPVQVALAAAQGLPALSVARRPTVAVFTTGDELVEPGLPLAHGQIYNANRELLMGLLRADGLEPVAWPTLPDDSEQVASAMRHAGHAFDLVLTIGGVSAGERDHLPALMRSEADVRFWKVAMRPGMPVLLAEGGRLGPALFLCLPGNPVSVLATYLALARPLLDGLQGRAAARTRLRARLAQPWRKTHDRLEFLRGRLESRSDGTLWVAPNPADASYRLRAAAGSDVLLVLDEASGERAEGSLVDVIPY